VVRVSVFLDEIKRHVVLDENAMNRTNAIFNTMFMFSPLVLLAFMVVATTPLLAIVVVAMLYLIGIALLIVSKRSMFRDGVLISFGPGQMDAKNRRRYLWAYGIFSVGILINLTSLLIYG